MRPTENDVVEQVRAVLAHASQSEPEDQYLTAYEIVGQLPADTRAALVAQYGRPGAHAGNGFTVVSAIARVARAFCEYRYIDGRGLASEFHEGMRAIGIDAPGYPWVGVYRVAPGRTSRSG